MTATEKDWLLQKRQELNRWIETSAAHGHPDVLSWDLFKFMVIVGKQAREIRRLKTELAAKLSKPL